MVKKFDEFINKHNNNWSLINESQESKSQSEAIKLLMDKLGWDKQKANNFVRVDLRNDITPLRDKQIGKFTLGVTRMYCDRELKDANIISSLNATLKLLSAHLNEYDRNLNGLSADELISKFEITRENNIKKEKQEISRMKFGVSEYDIVKIDSFNDAKKYYIYTNPNSRWCLTHMENMFNSYTCDGLNQTYFCLKNGFEDIKPIVGENAPLDDYGLSMLSIIVNEEGELAYCTCRWNHDKDGNDSVMDAVEISKVVNVNFYEIFKSNSKWKDIVNDAQSRLKDGESPKNIFDIVVNFEDGYTRVKLNKKYNFINADGEIISDKWFDNVYEFSDGYARVYLNHKYNFINTDGKIISDKWFDNVSEFSDGYAIVILNKKYNFINTDGEIISDKWFDNVSEFSDGYARVKLNNKYNFINTDFEFISDKWFDSVYDFSDGYARVILNNKFTYINTDGEIISDEWFDHAGNFNCGYAKVGLNNKFTYINTDGKIISDKWFDSAYEFSDGYAKVKLNKKYNFINTDFEFISDEWFDSVSEFSDGYARVKLNNKYNFINTDGKIISDKWFDDKDDARRWFIYNK